MGPTRLSMACMRSFLGSPVPSRIIQLSHFGQFLLDHPTVILCVLTKFWRILNTTLLKGQGDTSNIVFDMGNNQYSSSNDACEVINSHFASVWQKLHAQFDIDNTGDQ